MCLGLPTSPSLAPLLPSLNTHSGVYHPRTHSIRLEENARCESCPPAAPWGPGCADGMQRTPSPLTWVPALTLQTRVSICQTLVGALGRLLWLPMAGRMGDGRKGDRWRDGRRTGWVDDGWRGGRAGGRLAGWEGGRWMPRQWVDGGIYAAHGKAHNFWAHFDRLCPVPSPGAGMRIF